VVALTVAEIIGFKNSGSEPIDSIVRAIPENVLVTIIIEWKVDMLHMQLSAFS
jgi:hypothetical protein